MVTRQPGLAALAILISALLGQTCTSSESGDPAPTDPGDRPSTFAEITGPALAFHSDPGGLDDTFLTDPASGEVTPVTAGLETVARPVWSPNGDRMVVVCCASGDLGRLFLIDGPGAEPIELAPGVPGAIDPAWSPDGSAIAFGSFRDRSLYVVRVDGAVPSEPRPLGIQGAGPSWSPDGRRLAFFTLGGGKPDIATIALDERKPKILTNDPAADYSPQWSPDGRSIAFLSERGGDADVYVMASDGSSTVDVSRDRWPNDSVAWAPDGRSLAYVVYRNGANPETIGDGDAEVFVVSANGGYRRNLTHDRAWEGDPAWSPDGSTLVITRRMGNARLYLIGAAGGHRRRLRGTAGDGNDCCAAWRPEP